MHIRGVEVPQISGSRGDGHHYPLCKNLRYLNASPKDPVVLDNTFVILWSQEPPSKTPFLSLSLTSVYNSMTYSGHVLLGPGVSFVLCFVSLPDSANTPHLVPTA